MTEQNKSETMELRLRRWVKGLLQRWFRVEVRGHYQPGRNTVIIANRTSVIDVLLLSIFLPERLTVALQPQMYKKLWVKALMYFTDVIPVDPASATATRLLIKAIRAGKRCVIFPQGLQVNQQSSLKIFDGPGLVLQKAGAAVLPIRIEGAQNSIFSISKDRDRVRLFPRIRLHIEAQQFFTQNAHEPVDREALALRLFRLFSDMTFRNNFQPQPLFTGFIAGARMGQKFKSTIEDSNRNPLSYRQVLARCFILGRQFKDQTAPGEIVGLMMPTTIAGMVCFFALQAYRRIPAMLNFSTGFYSLYSACQTAKIKTIYTSWQFVQTAKLEPLVAELRAAGIQVHYLEDFKPAIHLGRKLAGIVKGYFPLLTYRSLGPQPSSSDKAVILFTSGSEGVPKGVVLSHDNVLANCHQMMSRVDFSHRDVFFNSLPIFHCFGLTAGSILPLMAGMSCFFYPSPLHYKIIPGLIYQIGATIMLGTDTFLTGYARAAASHDFSSIRYIFAGAEKVKPETVRHWAETFGARIYEGYGATEASPVIALNCPLASRLGTVGMPLSGIDIQVEAVEGITEGGRLFLHGPNVMKGYMRAEHPGVLETLLRGWHDTGDIVKVDNDGFITIIGRAKRFAKLGGEMVSLTSVESIASAVWPEILHAALTLPCARKGEQVILYTEAAVADKADFIHYVRTQGHSELLVPQQIVTQVKIPILPSGKIDYLSLAEQVKSGSLAVHEENPVSV